MNYSLYILFKCICSVPDLYIFSCKSFLYAKVFLYAASMEIRNGSVLFGLCFMWVTLMFYFIGYLRFCRNSCEKKDYFGIYGLYFSCFLFHSFYIIRHSYFLFNIFRFIFVIFIYFFPFSTFKKDLFYDFKQNSFLLL